MRILLPFTSSKTLVALATALLISSTVQAQQVAAGLPGQRVLGERTVGADGGIVDVDVFNKRGYAVGVGVNLPLTPWFDLGAHYGHAWIDDTGIGLKDSTLSATGTVHAAGPGLKPFAGVLLGHQRMEIKVGPFHETDNSGLWGGGVGLEIPVGKGSLTPGIAYTDSFDGTTDRTTHFTLHGNYWFTPKVAGYADVTYADFAGDGDNAWVCRLGLRLKF